MENSINVTLHKSIQNKNFTIKFQEMYHDILNEVEYAKERGQLEELMNQDVRISIVDLEGTVIDGYATLFVGWLENGGVLLTGNMSDVSQ